MCRQIMVVNQRKLAKKKKLNNSSLKEATAGAAPFLCYLWIWDFRISGRWCLR